MAPSKAFFFLAAALLLLAFATSGQTTNGAPPPPTTTTLRPPRAMKCTEEIISSVADCVSREDGQPIVPQDCCPAIAELPNKVAAKCVCAGVREGGTRSIISRGSVAAAVLYVCDKDPQDPSFIDCDRL